MSDTNTKAVLVGVNTLALQLVAGMKDGVVGDAVEFWTRFQTDATFQATLQTAFNDLKAAQAELPTLTAMDYLDLAQTELAFIPQFVAAATAAPAPATETK